MTASSFAFAKLFASSDITVDFDVTFLAQVLLFTTFVVLLKPVLFDPLLKVFEEREKRTEGAKKLARSMDDEAGELSRRYEVELEKIRHEASREREKWRAETAQLESKMMNEARQEAAAILSEGQQKLASEVAQLRKELTQNKPALATQIASRILDREVRQ